jgi:fermentation-respiration switch protein FrsA (DUF1100 family)
VRCCLAALLLALLLQGCVSSLIYFPDREIHPIPAGTGLAPRWVFLEAKDGVRLSAWYLPPQTAERGVVLFLHGNGGNVSHYADALARFDRLGFGSFAPDYRGYGRSEGTPSEAGLYRDAEAAWEHLVHTLGIPPKRIVIYGRSLGGAVAAWLTRSRSPRLLVLESSFTSLRAVAARLYPWAPTGLLLGEMFDTEGFVREVRCPVLVIHSPDDEIVPYAHGLRLFERAKPPKRLLEIRGGHNSGRYDSLTPDDLEPSRWGEAGR